jgi:hypothetical protein
MQTETLFYNEYLLKYITRLKLCMLILFFINIRIKRKYVVNNITPSLLFNNKHIFSEKKENLCYRTLCVFIK